MQSTNALSVHLSLLGEYAQLSSGKAKMLMESCVWSLWHCDHENGVKLTLDYEDKHYSYSVIWKDNEIDRDAIMRSYNQNDATEYGAEAIAILMSLDRTNYDSVNRAVTSTGIDYWLGYKNKNPNNPFEQAARLEISGIIAETSSNSINRRLKEKLDQTCPTHHTGLPVFVVIVEFSNPKAKMTGKL